MSLPAKVEQLLAAGSKLKSSGGNEANTKALLIEPLLAELGWDTSDLAQVEREYRVFDGTSLDYALKIDGEPRLFVEAKAVGKPLEDKAFISQTVNYANNEGVVWCVLTNGVAYRIYKTNEPVAMEEKLLFEIDLAEAGEGSAGEVSESLWLIGRESLAGGHLETWGERVFADKRVRGALASLAKKPPSELLAVVGKTLGKPTLPAERLQESLARILDVGEGVPPPVPSEGQAGTQPKKAKKATPAKEFSLDHHLAGMPAAIVDLFGQVDEFGRSLGPDVSRRIRKFYVGYFAGKRSFFTVGVQRQRLIVHLNLDPDQTSPWWNAKAMRDVREIGTYGLGDSEFSLREPGQLDEVKSLIKTAYEATT